MKIGTFRYGMDPLCLIACSLYSANRWLIKPNMDWAFTRNHFNDLLLIPCALPMVLWAQHRLGLRQTNRNPNGREILLHLVIWAFFAEFIGPYLLHEGTNDWKDIAAYFTGAVISWIFWEKTAEKNGPSHL